MSVAWIRCALRSSESTTSQDRIDKLESDQGTDGNSQRVRERGDISLSTGVFRQHSWQAWMAAKIFFLVCGVHSHDPADGKSPIFYLEQGEQQKDWLP